MLRLALIGCGGHSSRNHAPALRLYAEEHPGDVKLAAVCDLDLDRANQSCERFGFACAYGNVDEMLAAEQLDGCLCVMGVADIVTMAIGLLERGMPCTIEKPPGSTLADVALLRACARETGTPHQISVNRRFTTHLNRGLQWARERGEIRMVSGSILRHQRMEPEFVWSTSIHVVDTVRYIGGDVAEDESFVIEAPELSCRWYEFSLGFTNGGRGHIRLVPTAGINDEVYEFAGENFRVLVNGEGVRGWADGELMLDEPIAEAPNCVTSGAYGELSEFVAALREGRAPKPGIEDVYDSARICFEAARAAGVINED